MPKEMRIMSKRIKLGALLLVFVLAVSVFTGCAANKSSNDGVTSEPGYPQEMPAEAPSAPAPMPEPIMEESKGGDYGLGSNGTGSIEPDKIITTVYLGAETTEFDESLESLYSLIQQAGGYLASSNIYYGSYYEGTQYRNGEFSIRIPRDKVNQFRTQLPEIGNITSESTSKEDVTRYYRDTESRLNVLTIKEERLLSLLEKAEKIEDIIALENQLSEVIYEKENLKATLINLDDRIDYSTFNLTLREVAKVTTTETVETTFMDRVRNAFDNSLYQFVRSAENFAIFLIYNGPFLLVLLIVFFVLYLIVRSIIRKLFGKSKRAEAPKFKEPPKEAPKEENKE
jgi:hypothetical protein